MAIKASSQISIVDVSDGAEGKGISSVTPEYYLSTSKTTQTGGSWSTTSPTWSSGKYLWVRQIVTYTDSTVERTTPYCDSSWEAVNDVQVGGRNLYLGTKDFSGEWININSWDRLQETYNGFTVMSRTGEWTGLYQSFYGVVGETYTFSGYVKKTGGDTLVFANSNKPNYAVSNPSYAVIGTAVNVWEHFSFTTTVTQTGILLFRVENNSSTGTTYVCGLKLEKGNKATDWSPAPEDVNHAIDNIQVGSRNLLLNTKSFTEASSTSLNGSLITGTPLLEDKYRDLAIRGCTVAEGETGVCRYNFTDFNLGDTFTFSFYAKGDVSKLNAYFYGNPGYVQVAKCVNSLGETSTNADGWSSFYITSDWQRYWVTWTLKSTGDISVPKYVLLRTKTETSGQTVYVCGCKLEMGNKATDWSPAPEDVNHAIDNIQVGGRNLLLNTGESSTIIGENKPDQCLAHHDLACGSITKLEAGEYTCSADIVGTVEGGTAHMQFYGPPWETIPEMSGNVTIKTTKQKIGGTFTLTSPQSFSATGMRVRTDNVSGTITVSNMKLEKGNKATDWSPAPEDVEADATKKANEAAKTATNYMDLVDDGLVIYNRTTGTLGKNVLIDNDSVDIRNGNTVLASYGTKTTIGATTGRYILIDNNSVDIRNGNTVLASYGTKTTIGATTGRHILIDNDSVDIRHGNTVLASYGDNIIYLGKNNRNATIDFCNGLGKIYNYKEHLAIESTDIYIDSSIYPHTAHISLNATKDGEKLVIGAEKMDGSANVNGSIIEVRSNKIDIGTYTIFPAEPGGKVFDSRIYSEYGKGTTITGKTTITGTLVLSNTTDASGKENKSPALIVGGTATTAHIEIDSNEIMAKSNGTTPTGLSLNSDGGNVYIGNGGSGNLIGVCQIVKMGSKPATIKYQSGRTKALIEFWKTSIGSSNSHTVYDSAYVTGLSNKMTAKNVNVNNGPDFSFTYSISAAGEITVSGTFSKYRITYFN